MKESLLQYIWQFQQFDTKSLCTTTGEKLQILDSGKHNRDAGPDFLHAKLAIGNVTLHGHVEVHYKSSDWYGHQHDKDAAYQSVILHVVWEANQVVHVAGKPLPTLVLHHRVKSLFLERYEGLMRSRETILCKSHLANLPLPQWERMVERALFQRLDQQHNRVEKLFTKNNQDSEATAYQLLAKNFGFKVNSASFFALSEKVPFKVIQKYQQNLLALEAILLGQAGFLESIRTRSHYLQELSKTYTYLKHKHQLKAPLAKSQWKFFRLRPANFPTVRIAQFARVLYKQKSLFYLLINPSYQALQAKLRVAQSTYWKTHYLIHKRSKSKIANIGKASIDNLIINTTIPLLVAYGKLRANPLYMEHAIALLKKLPPEKNYITKKWKKIGMPIRNAFDSQGALALYQYFCTPKKCLTCDIGKRIIQATP